MNSGWAVVLGSIVAFAGTIFGSWLAGRREEKRESAAREREDAKERWAALGVGIFDLLAAHLDQVSICEGSTPDEQAAGMKRSLLAALSLGLMLDQGDQAIVPIVQAASKKISAVDEDAFSALSALTSVLPAWRRGTMTAWEALDAYRESTGDPVPIPDESRHRRERASR